ncbi:fungal specific transcription factor [Phlyctema vagabunda]|uniref:Fungal specific transcription factor n=1 Tax=Phlyctema vagabunda TaxID=108571 RepID=A0ABR4PU03_9HELO
MPEKRRAPSGPPEEREDIDATSSTDPRLASCESCKSRKLKCDRSQPSCMRCQRSGAECVYHERKRPGFQAGFRQTMEERLSIYL